MSENKITAFVDSVGRVIVGREVSSEDSDKLSVTNPSVVNINVNQENGQITVQLLPYIFREFITAKKRYDKHVWKFNKQQITVSDEIELDDSIITQYVNIFETAPAPAEEKVEDPVPTVEVAEDAGDGKE